MSINVFGYFDVKSQDRSFISDFKIRIRDFANARILNGARNTIVVFAEDYEKLDKKIRDNFEDYYYLFIESNDNGLEARSQERSYNEIIDELVDETLRLLKDESYQFIQSLTASIIKASTDGGESASSLFFVKENGERFFSYDDYVVQDTSLCVALKACGAFELNVGERWVGMEENFFVIMEKIAEESANDHTDMLFVMDNSHDEMNACYQPVLVKVRVNTEDGNYYLIGYLNQYVKYTKNGETLDLNSYPLAKVMCDFFENQDISTIGDLDSVAEVDKHSMNGLTEHIILGCDLKKNMLVKKFRG